MSFQKIKKNKFLDTDDQIGIFINLYRNSNRARRLGQSPILGSRLKSDRPLKKKKRSINMLMAANRQQICCWLGDVGSKLVVQLLNRQLFFFGGGGGEINLKKFQKIEFASARLGKANQKLGFGQKKVRLKKALAQPKLGISTSSHSI